MKGEINLSTIETDRLILMVLDESEANVMEDNKPSIRILEKLGFIYEGISNKILEVNGEWKDHLHYALINEYL